MVQSKQPTNEAFRSRSSYSHPSASTQKANTNDAKGSCKELIKILFRKIKVDAEKYDDSENENSGSSNVQPVVSAPHARASTYQQNTTTPSWATGSTRSSAVVAGTPSNPGLPPRTTPGTGGRGAIWEKRGTDSRPPASPAPMKPRQSMRSGGPGSASNTDLAKAGIQVGLTKVFLRHSAFEALERLRSQEQGRAANKINSVFRMFLARRAYIHVRNMVRNSMHDLVRYESEYKETKEQDYDDDNQFDKLMRIRNSYNSYNGEQPSLVQVWATQIRAAIHNPLPRHEWGKQTPTGTFKWMLVDGLWVKNEIFE